MANARPPGLVDRQGNGLSALDIAKIESITALVALLLSVRPPYMPPSCTSGSRLRTPPWLHSKISKLIEICDIRSNDKNCSLAY